eukprot:SAG31_NODE_10764_length_1100_cov_2.595405_2_plen_57_part_00
MLNDLSGKLYSGVVAVVPKARPVLERALDPMDQQIKLALAWQAQLPHRLAGAGLAT